VFDKLHIGLYRVRCQTVKDVSLTRCVNSETEGMHRAAAAVNSHWSMVLSGRRQLNTFAPDTPSVSSRLRARF